MEVSNVKAMREALEKIREKCVIYNNDLAEEIDAICGNALAAPPRNCDRFADFNEAIRTFAKERPNDKKKWDMERYARFAMWLLALTEKGEANGSK